jgi:predicted phosphodiesterase
MRYLILSDCHGNQFGLQAVLESALGNYDALLSLGDVVGYGAHPNECCDLLRAAGGACPVACYLLGNHDAAALKLIDASWFNPIARFAIEWTGSQLTTENRDWLTSLQPTMIDAKSNFQAVHASLREPIEEYIVNVEIALGTFAIMGHPLCFYGHTHVADCYAYRIVESRSLLGRRTVRPEMQHAPLTEGGTIELNREWKYLINPGSCGQPRDGNPQARYAIFDDASQIVEVTAVDYDVQAARESILEAGLPALLGDRLLVGR